MPEKRTNQIDLHYSLNEQYVDDITLEFFYKPHSITLLLIVILLMIYLAFTQPSTNNVIENTKQGLFAIVICICAIGLLTFPNGPFIRPHPAVWRIVFALSVCYLLFLVFLLFQNVDDARQLIKVLLDPSLPGEPLPEKEYAADCRITKETVMAMVYDPYFAAHFIGWLIKALMMRDAAILWIASVLWELIELTFIPMLPNFKECWWDSLILDVLICNGLGIWCGLKLCKYLEMKEYKWAGMLSYPTSWGRVKRVLLQFTPHSWTKVTWNALSSVRRFLSVVFVIICFEWSELNCFFLKHILWIPSENKLNMYRLGLWALFGMPALRQAYLFITDDRVVRLGVQAWVALAVLITETLVCIKFGQGMFPDPIPVRYMVYWGCGAFVIFLICVGIYVRDYVREKEKKQK